MTSGTLKDVAKKNLAAIGDPVSLEIGHKATDQDKTGGAGDGGGHKSLKQIAEEKNKTNPSQLGDPVSLRAEYTDTEPTENDRGAGKTSTKHGAEPKL